MRKTGRGLNFGVQHGNDGNRWRGIAHGSEHFMRAMRSTRELEEKGYRTAYLDPSQIRKWHVSRAAAKAVYEGWMAVDTGTEYRIIGTLSPDEVNFARGYYLIAREGNFSRSCLERGGAMLEYVKNETPEGFKGRGFFSHFTVVLDKAGGIAGAVTGAVLNMNEDHFGTAETLVFNGYRVVRKDLRGIGIGHVLMNAAIECSFIHLGIEPTYTFGEAEETRKDVDEIRVMAGTGRYPIRKIDYRQPDLAGIEGRKGSIFGTCSPLTACIGTQRSRTEISLEEVRNVVRTVYRYYDLAGDTLKEFMDRMFAGVKENAGWVLQNKEFVPK